MTVEKIKNVVVVFGAARNAMTAMPREAYSSESTDFMRQRPIAQPAVKLPKMLNRPISESDQAATSAGSWHDATTPGRRVALKATRKPPTNNPVVAAATPEPRARPP